MISDDNDNAHLNHQSIGRNEGREEHSINTASSISPIIRIIEHTHPA